VYVEKVDGYRMLAYRDGKRIRLVSRNGVDHAKRFLEKLAEEYSLILKAEGTDVVPTILGDWKKPFRVAWIRD
jgi:ATP-dependent DNA ligase